MKVTDIDIRDLNWDDTFGFWRGYVSMTMEPADGGMAKRVNFICQARRAFDCPSSLITYDMVAHAFEQARSMPGFRRGEEDIQVDIRSRLDALPFAKRA